MCGNASGAALSILRQCPPFAHAPPQALQLAGDGDVVLLSPGRYQLYAEDAVLKRSIHIIGMGARHQVCKCYKELV